MKTKSLILTALLSVAGSTGLMAQSNVYSLNIVGYVNQVIPSGYSMVACQLTASPDNQIGTVFPAPPNHATLYKFNSGTGSYIVNTFYNGLGWDGDDPTTTLAPGEGAFIYTDTAFTNTFVGQLKLGSTNSIVQGYSIVSSTIPQAGDLDTLGFPHVANLNTFQFNNATRSYIQNQYYNGFGYDGDTGGTPVVAVGEAFFVYSPSATNWVRNFSVGP